MDIQFGTSEDRLDFNFGSTQVVKVDFGNTNLWLESIAVALSINAPDNTTLTTAFPTQTGAPGSSFSADFVLTADSGNRITAGPDSITDLSTSGDALPSGWNVSTVLTSGFGNTATVTISGTIPTDAAISETVTITAGGITVTGNYNVDFLVVGGGGGGGTGQNYDTGGGAGGLKTSWGDTQGGGQSSSNKILLSSGTTYTITVGEGGSTNTTNTSSKSGGDSSISGGNVSETGEGGNNGIQPSGNSRTGGSAGSPGYAAAAFSSSLNLGGGGGGAGSTSTLTFRGAGLTLDITGDDVIYASGGHGNYENVNDSNVNSQGTYGSGGDADSAGQDGVVILRILTSDYSDTKSGGTTTTDGDYTIVTWTSSGSYTA